MSQITKIFDGTILPDIETITAPTGGAVAPDPATYNINFAEGPGVYIIGDPVTHTLTFGRTSYITGSCVTKPPATGDTDPKTIVSFDMGTFAGVYTIEGKISALNVTDVAGAGYFFSAAFRTTGAVGTLIDVSYGINFEEAAMLTADYNVIVSGNDIVIQAVGILNKELHWSADFDYVLAL